MEKIEVLNQRLIDHYGLDTNTNQPMFRIVWANDQFEKRLIDKLRGVALLFPVVAEVPKYSYLKDFYVLERLVIVPEINLKELPTSKLSYEPIWAYRDNNNNPLPPLWPATKFIIDALYAALGKKSMAKYVEDNSPEVLEDRVVQLQKELFGNETETGDALRYKEGIVVPANYNKGESNGG
jgi:hypothetical protein